MILLGVISLSLLTGCGKKEETPAVSDTAQETSISAPEEVPVSEPEIPAVPEGMARSYLTGEWIDETIANQRPLAVMLGNTKIATPQYGITDADVIYEAAVEGQETRLMAIFQDYANGKSDVHSYAVVIIMYTGHWNLMPFMHIMVRQNML